MLSPTVPKVYSAFPFRSIFSFGKERKKQRKGDRRKRKEERRKGKEWFLPFHSLSFLEGGRVKKKKKKRKKRNGRGGFLSPPSFPSK